MAGRYPGRGSSLKSHKVPASSQAARCGPKGAGTPRPRRGGRAGRWHQQCGRSVCASASKRAHPRDGNRWPEAHQPLGGSPSGQRRRGRGGRRDSSQGPLVCKLDSHRKLATSDERKTRCFSRVNTQARPRSSPNSSLLLKAIISHNRIPSHKTPKEGCFVEDTPCL